MQKKILTLEQFKEIDSINLNEYNINLSKIPIDLIEYIIKENSVFYAEWKSEFLFSLFSNGYFLHKTGEDFFYKIDNLNDIFYNHLKETYLYNIISKNQFVSILYYFINYIYNLHDLRQCEKTKELFSLQSFDVVTYYNALNYRMKVCEHNINKEDCVYYFNSYYHKNLCVIAHTANGEDLIPRNCAYLYNGEFYDDGALSENDLFVYNGEVFHIDDGVYCEDSGNTIHIDDAYYCESDECYYEHESSIKNKNGLRDYHKSDVEDKSKDSVYKIGFEIEKEDEYFTDFSMVRKYGWDAERDGSLNDDGFELVSPIYDLMDDKEFSNDMEHLSEFINADFSSNCGGHINISVRDKDATQIFDLVRGYLPLIYAMYPHRLDNRYAKAKKVNEFTEDRYEAINFTKGNILEFRIFSAVRNVNNLKFRYKFIQYMFNNQRKGAASVVRMLLTDSALKKLLLSVYNENKYESLVDRVIKFTDIYMSQRDIKTTTTLIKKMKQGTENLELLIN